MTSQRPQRPIPSTSSALAPAAEPPAGIPTQAYADKARLARHLHAQGINPLLWTKAHPSPHAEQEQFRKTGQKPRENQFEVDGRLYESSPEIVATPAQGRADLSTYLQARGDPDTREVPPLESYVNIDKVPLQHPMGQAFILSDSPESKAVLRNMIKLGIDPKNAHLGDPLPMPTQERLQHMLKRIPFSGPNPDMPTTGEEPEASDILYRGADGWIYARNEATREPMDVIKIRARHAEKLAQQAKGSLGTAANENDPEEEDEILQHYLSQDQEMSGQSKQRAMELEIFTSLDGPSLEAKSNSDEDLNKISKMQLLRALNELPEIIVVVEKLRRGEPLNDIEAALQERLTRTLAQGEIRLDLDMVDTDRLKQVWREIEETLSDPSLNSSETLHVSAAILNLKAAQAIAGGNLDTIRMNQGTFSEALLRAGSALTRPLRKLLPTALLTSLNSQDRGDAIPDFFSPYGASAIELSSELDSAATLDNLVSVHGSLIPELIDVQSPEDPLEKYRQNDGVAVRIGNIVIKQHAHTNATDQIFLEEFLNVARSRGCEPEPDSRPGHEEELSIHGGTEKSQRRITDIDKPGHLGSVQPDATAGISGNGGSSSNHFNSMTTRADMITGIGLELEAARRILELMIKQLGASEKILESLVNPVRKAGHVFLYGKKWKWSLEKIRTHLRRKLEEVFDRYFLNCEPDGPPAIINLDDPSDPEFAEENE